MSLRVPEDRVSYTGPFREILISSGRTTAKVAPERGGIVTSFKVYGDEILYLDRQTFEDPTKNVRGGIPILFPNAGALKGEPYHLDQHGFARRMPWTLEELVDDSVVMKLIANDETKAKYPFDFELKLRVRVFPYGRIQHALEIYNPGEKGLPTAYGAHPYFKIADNLKPNIRTDIKGFDPASVNWVEEYDKAFPTEFHAVEVEIPANEGSLARRLRISATPDLFQVLYIWSLPGKDFLCIEPWSRLDNALNDPKQTVFIQPGHSLTLPMAITAA